MAACTKPPTRGPLRAALLGPTIQVMSEWSRGLCSQRNKIIVVHIWTQVESEAKAINQTFFNNEAECYFDKRTAAANDRRGHSPNAHGNEQNFKKRTLNALLNKKEGYDVIVVASPTGQQVRILEQVLKSASLPVCSLYPPCTANATIGSLLKKFFARRAIMEPPTVGADTAAPSAPSDSAHTTGASQNSSNAVNGSSTGLSQSLNLNSNATTTVVAAVASNSTPLTIPTTPLTFQWFVLEPIRMESAFNKLNKMLVEIRPVQGGEMISSGNFLSSYNRGSEQTGTAPSPLKPSESGDLQRLCAVAVSGLRRVLGEVQLANCTTNRPNSNMTDRSLETISGILEFQGGATVTTTLTTAGSIDSFSISLWGTRGQATLRWDPSRNSFETQMHLNHFEYPTGHKLSGHEWALASFVDCAWKGQMDTSTPQCALVESAVVEVMFQSNGASIGLRLPKHENGE